MERQLVLLELLLFVHAIPRYVYPPPYLFADLRECALCLEMILAVRQKELLVVGQGTIVRCSRTLQSVRRVKHLSDVEQVI
jgi:hypothetical protein